MRFALTMGERDTKYLVSGIVRFLAWALLQAFFHKQDKFHLNI